MKVISYHPKITRTIYIIKIIRFPMARQFTLVIIVCALYQFYKMEKESLFSIQAQEFSFSNE